MSSVEELFGKVGKGIIIASFLILAVAGGVGYLTFVQPKYSLTIYHFNVQYNAGDPVATERVLTNALYGLLKVYEKHPNWKFTIEIQGLAIEMLYENYTYIFNLLKELVDRGQCELIVTHYSDQLWIAYPAEDLIRSIKLSREILNKVGLKVADIAMFQEGQWSPGLVLLSDLGFKATLVSEDILRWFGVETEYPILKWKFADRQIYLVIFGHGVYSFKGITWSWRWVEDGEIATTLAYENDFQYVPRMAKNHEQRMQILEAMGWKFITVSEWIKIAEENNLIGDLNKYMPATTWNNPSCLGPFRWLGDHRAYWEDDGYVRGLNSIARGKVLAAEIIHEKYKNSLNETVRELLDKKIDLAWRYVFLAEVSDSTGWNPLENEVKYSNNYSELAIKLAEEVAGFYLDFLGVKYIQVLSFNKTVIATNNEEDLVKFEDLGDVESPVNIVAQGTTIKVSARKIKILNYSVIKVVITAQPSDNMTISITGDFNRIRISPALLENVTVLLNHSDYPRDFWLALSNGLIMSDNLAIIRNNSHRFIAIKWSSDKISFVETMQENKISYELFILQNANPEDALFLANLINVYPIVTFKR